VTGRIWKAILLIAVGVAGGGAALAVASVPGSDGVISACYPVTTNGSGHTVPVTAAPAGSLAGPYLRVIDTSAGQTCHTLTAGQGEGTLDFSQQGVPGAPGARGPAGRSATVVGANLLTISGGDVVTIAGSHGLTINTPTISPTAKPIGTMSITDGTTPITFQIFSMRFAGASATGGGGGAGKGATEVVVTKTQDSASPNLFQACANGQHFPRATLSLRKAGAGDANDPIYVLSGPVRVSSYSIGSGGDRPTESLTFSFTKVS
jgi:hypothetical protein